MQRMLFKRKTFNIFISSPSMKPDGIFERFHSSIEMDPVRCEHSFTESPAILLKQHRGMTLIERGSRSKNEEMYSCEEGAGDSHMQSIPPYGLHTHSCFNIQGIWIYSCQVCIPISEESDTAIFQTSMMALDALFLLMTTGTLPTTKLVAEGNIRVQLLERENMSNIMEGGVPNFTPSTSTVSQAAIHSATLKKTPLHLFEITEYLAVNMNGNYIYQSDILQAGNPDDNGAANTCSICIMSRSEEEEKQQMCQLLCHHKFHLKCITLWLMKRSTCPVCRTPVFLLPN